MKKLVLAIAVLGIALFSSCEKDEQLVPAEKTAIKPDKASSCRGCANHD